MIRTAFVLSIFVSVSMAPLAYGERIGFFASTEEAYARAEAAYLDTPTPKKSRAWLRKLTEEPHVAGTKANRKVAEFVKEKFEDFGLETEMVEYEVFLNYPKADPEKDDAYLVDIRLVLPVEEVLATMEEPLDVDKDSTAHNMFPAFHGYGAEGAVQAQVVYVNYGTPADFKTLEGLGISVEGKIALARYGKVFRGLKVKEAQDRGAVGVLIFSDPADDGYMKGDVYPDGPLRPASAIQRGSVQYLSIQPGDPSTPGYPSTARAKRVAREDMKTVPSIPSLPMSYASAEKILRRMGGPNVPEGWQGGLPFPYHVGPGGAVVSMSVEYDQGLRTIQNIIGRIPGTDGSGQVVVLGNHYDAWNHGAVDPNSGTAVMLETARGLGAALKMGWKPRRTIILAVWDAEEYGLVGSVEWAEANAKTLQENAVAYINLDSSVTGDEFGAAGSPSLRDLAREVAGDLSDPKRGGTVGAAWEKRLRGEWNKTYPVVLGRPDPPYELFLSPLGSGSDYTAFLDHLGIPSLNFGFSGDYGVYHSVYDNFRWMDKFGDPGFHYHAVAARFYGMMAMRLASADVVPLRFGSYGRSLEENLNVLRRDTIRKARTEAEEGSDEGAALNPDFGAIVSALEKLGEAGRALDDAVDSAVAAESREDADRLNTVLIQVERDFLSDEGLPPMRPWFRHVLFAPGTTTGYASWPFPGPRQALEDRDADAFDHETRKVLEALEAATARLNGAAR